MEIKTADWSALSKEAIADIVLFSEIVERLADLTNIPTEDLVLAAVKILDREWHRLDRQEWEAGLND